ncbi:hypothetical protein FRB93_002168 [Tulasnella sp. JGI-2019a]|nr:hypothetical protein FRB93_002168 [Tulasnella sp. JGI-2019a]
MTSIHELPAEVLGIIFFEFTEQEGGWNRRQRPEDLAVVCRMWKELVRGYPELWSCIEVNLGYMREKVERIRTKVRMAKQSSLAIYIHCGYGFTSENLTRDVQILYDLIKNHRWRALSIFDPRYGSCLEIIFRHIIDNPQRCRMTSFHMESRNGFDAGMSSAREALRQDLGISHLAVSTGFLEASHPLFQSVRHLQLLGKWSSTAVLGHLQEATSLLSLRVQEISGGPEWNDSIQTSILPDLKSLEFKLCHQFPMLLMQRLELPSMQHLTFNTVSCSIKQGDEQLKSLFPAAPWLTQIKSLTLEDVQISEATLLFALRRLRLLEDLTISSRERISCRTTKALSQKPKTPRGWLCPLLERIKFENCPRIEERNMVALVRARVRDIPDVGPNSLHPVRFRKVVWEGQDMV